AVRPGRARGHGRRDGARLHHRVHRQDDLGARVRGDARGRHRAHRLGDRSRPAREPAGRGRARTDGRGVPRRRLHRGRDPHDGGHEHAADRRARADGEHSVSRRLLVVGAHSADFVWRAGGAIAVCTAAGGTASVVALSYGERGESGELWKEPDQTVENVKQIRHAEAERAAAHLGATFRCLDFGDYPLDVDHDRLLQLTELIRDFAPDVLVTHTDTDPFNPDHGLASVVVARARSLAAGAGVPSAFRAIRPPALYLFEPHQPELCNFTPTTFVDITSVAEAKQAAMAEMKAQQYLQTYYAQRAEQRGNHARRAIGN